MSSVNFQSTLIRSGLITGRHSHLETNFWDDQSTYIRHRNVCAEWVASIFHFFPPKRFRKKLPPMIDVPRWTESIIWLNSIDDTMTKGYTDNQARLNYGDCRCIAYTDGNKFQNKSTFRSTDVPTVATNRGNATKYIECV